MESNLGLNTLFQLRGPRPAADQIVIVAMDEVSETDLGVGQTLSRWRGLHAQLIRELQKQGTALIVFDLQFIQPDATHDVELAVAMRESGNVLLPDCVQKFRHGDEDFFGRAECSELHKQPALSREGGEVGAELAETLVAMRKVPAQPLLAAVALDHAGFYLLGDSANAAVRESWLYYDALAEAPSLPLVIWMHYLVYTGQLPASLIERGQHPSDWLTQQRRDCLAESAAYSLPDTLSAEWQARLRAIVCGGDSRYLDFYGPAKTFRMESYRDVYRGQVSNLQGKVVLVSKVHRQFSPSVVDVFQTPFSDPRHGKMAGVEIMATQLANLLENRFVEMPIPINLALLLFGLLVALPLTLLNGLTGVVVSLLLGSTYAGLCFWGFRQSGLWLPVAVPLLIQLPVAWLTTLAWARRDLLLERKRMLEFVRKVFPQWATLAPAAPGRWQQDSAALQAVSERNVTGICLATDIESYTRIAAQRSPHEMWELLNAYYQVLGQPVSSRAGVIADVTGDAMMALWVDMSPAERRQSACLAALEIDQSVQRFNAASGFDDMHTRIGLYEGDMTLGNLSTGNSSHFRAIGDTVNTASRIEGVNKHLGTRILACQTLVYELDMLCCRPVGVFRLLGRSEPVELVEIMALAAHASPRQLAVRNQFAVGLQAFREGDWGGAIKRFDRLLKEHNVDGPSRYFLTLAIQHRQNPDIPWDGVISLNYK